MGSGFRCRTPRRRRRGRSRSSSRSARACGLRGGAGRRQDAVQGDRRRSSPAFHEPCLAGDRRSRHQGHVDSRPGHCADRPSAGRAVFRQRRRQRVRERAGDCARAEADDRRRPAAAAAPRHPVLVGGRDQRARAVLRRSSRRARAVSGQHQPGHGRRQAVGRAAACSLSRDRPPAAPASWATSSSRSSKSLVQGNTAYLSAGQARQSLQTERVALGRQRRHRRAAVLERRCWRRLGTRERYDARVVPFHNNTDHQVFNMATIGIPGVTFTNWPDDYIHSTDDDLWQMDATQLKRNAVAVAVGGVGAGHCRRRRRVRVVGRGRRPRPGADRSRHRRRACAGTHLAQPGLATSALTLVRESASREQRTLASLRRLAPGAEATAIAAALEQLPTPEAAEARLRALSVASGRPGDARRRLRQPPLRQAARVPDARRRRAGLPRQARESCSGPVRCIR